MVAEKDRSSSGKIVRSKNQEIFGSVPMMSPNTETTVQTSRSVLETPKRKKQIKGGVNFITSQQRERAHHTPNTENTVQPLVLETSKTETTVQTSRSVLETPLVLETSKSKKQTADMKRMSIVIAMRSELEELKRFLAFMEAEQAEHAEHAQGSALEELAFRSVRSELEQIKQSFAYMEADHTGSEALTPLLVFVHAEHALRER